MTLNGIQRVENTENEVIQIDGFTDISHTSNLSLSFLKSLKRSFSQAWKYKEVLNNPSQFSGKTIYNYGDDVLLFQYPDSTQRDGDMQAWKSKFKKLNPMTAELIDDRQILEPSWCFEYEWKYYLLGYLYRDTNTQDNNEELGVMNGVIVNHEKYFWVHENVEEEVVKNGSTVDKLLGG